MPAPLLVQLRDLVREFGPGQVAQLLPTAIHAERGSTFARDRRLAELYHRLDETQRAWWQHEDPMPDSVHHPTAFVEWCERQHGTLQRDGRGLEAA